MAASATCMVNKGFQQGLLFPNQGFRVRHNRNCSTINFRPRTSRVSIWSQQQPQFETLTSSHTDCALSVANNLLLKEEKYKDKNVMFSPLSLYTVLSALAAGSDGATLDEFLTFLRAKSFDDLNSFASQLASFMLRDAAPAGGPCLRFANGLWVDQSFPLHPSFKHLVTTDYKAILSSVDFRNKPAEVRNEVNLWAEKKTNGLIKDLLPCGSVNSFTRLILANALYFKGTWREMFDASMTNDYDFHLLNGTPVKVSFMTSMKDQCIGVFNGFKVLSLPYKYGRDNRHFSMCIFLLDANDGLPALIEQVTFESGFLEHHLPHKIVEVGDFMIPRVKFSFSLYFSDVLEKMGLVLPFSEYADFTKMVDPLISLEKPHVLKIIQKSFIDINEVGTEAAAVTATMMKSCGMHFNAQKINFVADHPFFLFN